MFIQSVTAALFLDYADTVSEIAVRIVTFIGIVIGIGYIHSLKIKRGEAVFGFWSKLKIRLKKISTALRNDNGLINNLYDSKRRLQYEAATPAAVTVQEFRNNVAETVSFLRDAEDQMPAYTGWTEDLNVIIEFASNIEVYEIMNPKGSFVPELFPDRTKYCADICTALDRMVNGIDAEQREIEKQICRKDV